MVDIYSLRDNTPEEEKKCIRVQHWQRVTAMIFVRRRLCFHTQYRSLRFVVYLSISSNTETKNRPNAHEFIHYSICCRVLRILLNHQQLAFTLWCKKGVRWDSMLMIKRPSFFKGSFLYIYSRIVFNSSSTSFDILNDFSANNWFTTKTLDDGRKIIFTKCITELRMHSKKTSGLFKIGNGSTFLSRSDWLMFWKPSEPTPVSIHTCRYVCMQLNNTSNSKLRFPADLSFN